MDTGLMPTLQLQALILPRRDPRLVVGGGFAAACAAAALIAVLVGHSSVPATTPREPRIAVVEEANEETTLLPLLAPEKYIEDDAAPAPARHHASRRTGFGHMGTDRTARHPWSGRR